MIFQLPVLKPEPGIWNSSWVLSLLHIITTNKESAGQILPSVMPPSYAVTWVQILGLSKSALIYGAVLIYTRPVAFVLVPQWNLTQSCCTHWVCIGVIGSKTWPCVWNFFLTILLIITQSPIAACIGYAVLTGDKLPLVAKPISYDCEYSHWINLIKKAPFVLCLFTHICYIKMADSEFAYH